MTIQQNIKLDLVRLGRKQIELLPEIRKRGFPNLYESQFRLYMTGRYKGAQGQAVLQLCRDIIAEWKAERKK